MVPSGLAYYPGTGLSDHFEGRFFLCDFRGGPAKSGVRSFKVKSKGAFFEMVDDEKTLWKILATDIDFAPDGSVLVSDWVNGWEGLNKGRIYRFVDSDRDENLAQETASILNSGVSDFTDDRLVTLLSHKDRRVRQEAQFELAARKKIEIFVNVATEGKSLFARLHSLWGLGQITRNNAITLSTDKLLPLLKDSEVEVRAHAAKLFAESKVTNAEARLIETLESDSNNRVKYFCAMGLGKLGSENAIPAICEMLNKNNNADPILRHGGIMALKGTGNSKMIGELSNHESAAVRLAATVALRKLKANEIVNFLDDVDPQVVLEAARAIHDMPIDSGFDALGKLIEKSSDSDPLLRRILNTHFRAGKKENFEALAKFAINSAFPEERRIDAVKMFADRTKPNNRDRVLGSWRPLNEQSPEIAKEVLEEYLPSLLAAGGKVATETTNVAAELGIKKVVPKLVEIVNDKSREGRDRSSAVKALIQLKYDKVEPILEEMITDEKVWVRITGRMELSKLNPKKAIPSLVEATTEGIYREQQSAFRVLAKLKNKDAQNAVVKGLEKLVAGDADERIKLDLIRAANLTKNEKAKQLLVEYRKTRTLKGPTAMYEETTDGGHANRGRKIFFERTAVSCLRCHKINGQGGDVGPDLSKIGSQQKRDYIRNAIITPNKDIAKGFETVIIDTIDGLTFNGIVKEKTDKAVTLINADGKLKTIPLEDIDFESKGDSSMPADLIKQLNQDDVRDLVEYLSTLK